MIVKGVDIIMPMYLKKDTIKFLEASIETISMAIMSLGIPERIELRNSETKRAITIGMIGISVELAMNAILVQANGNKSLLLPSGQYKSASMILDDFKKLIKEKNLKLSFLIKDVDNVEIQQKLFLYTIFGEMIHPFEQSIKKIRLAFTRRILYQYNNC